MSAHQAPSLAGDHNEKLLRTTASRLQLRWPVVGAKRILQREWFRNPPDFLASFYARWNKLSLGLEGKRQGAGVFRSEWQRAGSDPQPSAYRALPPKPMSLHSLPTSGTYARREKFRARGLRNAAKAG